MNARRTLTASLACAMTTAAAGQGLPAPNEVAVQIPLPRPSAPPAGKALQELAGSGFTDGFDTYLAGSGIAGQGGWETYYDPIPGSGGGGGDAFVSDLRAGSAPNSLDAPEFSSVVRQVAITDGRWELLIQTYVPSSAPPGAGGWVILMNRYGSVTLDRWSLQLALNETTFPGAQLLPYMIESQWDGAVLPLKLDEWVEIRAEIDLDADRFSTWYGGAPLGVDLTWTDNGFFQIGVREIGCINLVSWANDVLWFDTIVLRPLDACYADCDGSGALDFFDFLCFQDDFAAGAPDADCDGSGALDFFDFLCFQNAFAAGCP